MTTAGAVKEAMRMWNVIEAAAKKRFPAAGKEEIYSICKDAMDRVLKIKR